MQALHTAATGMAAQELNVQVISNNIANLRTTGYKKQTASFQDLIYEHVRRVGAQASDQGTILPVGIDIGGGVKTVGTPRSMTQGTLSQTGNDLDLALTGEGFFKILMPDGTYQYTRDGTFQMDNTGRIVTAQGNPVTADDHDPEQCLGPDRQRPGPGLRDAAGIDQHVHDHRPDRPDAIHQQGRPAAGRQQPIHRHAIFRRAAGWSRQRRRLCRHHARQPRTGERRRRLGNVGPDRRATRLRNEREGNHRGRPDDAIHHRAVPLRELTMTARAFIFAAILLAATSVTAWAQDSEEVIAGPVLRSTVTVESDVVRIGDMIDNAGTSAQIAIYRAPDLGTTGSLPTAQVIAALQAHQVIGVDTRDIKAVSVTRLSRAFEGKEIEAAVAHTLEHRNGLGGRRQSRPDLRPRHRRYQAGGLEHRRTAADLGPLRATQRPLRYLLRGFER